MTSHEKLRVVVVGNGNVALDAARILTADPESLVDTEIAPHALAALREADVAEVVVIARRGPEHAAFTLPDGRVLGTDPESGHEIVAKSGRYGPYVTEVLPEVTPADGEKPKKKAAKPKPRTASLFKDMDLATIELDTALKLLSLPRVVGVVEEKATAEDGTETTKQVEITAQNGRYGPYLKKGTDSRSLENEAQLFTITLEEAEAIYAQPKQRGRAAAKPPLKEFGADPTSGKPVVVKDGRFGEYVTDGETNATLRKDDDVETLTAERAYELLAEKRAKGPSTRKKAAKKSTKKAATKKTAAKKTTTKKTAAKKTTAKKA